VRQRAGGQVDPGVARGGDDARRPVGDHGDEEHVVLATERVDGAHELGGFGGDLDGVGDGVHQELGPVAHLLRDERRGRALRVPGAARAHRDADRDKRQDDLGADRPDLHPRRPARARGSWARQSAAAPPSWIRPDVRSSAAMASTAASSGPPGANSGRCSREVSILMPASASRSPSTLIPRRRAMQSSASARFSAAKARVRPHARTMAAASRARRSSTSAASATTSNSSSGASPIASQAPTVITPARARITSVPLDVPRAMNARGARRVRSRDSSTSARVPVMPSIPPHLMMSPVDSIGPTAAKLQRPPGRRLGFGRRSLIMARPRAGMTSGDRFLMCAPRFYRVAYVINPWMEGNVGRTDAEVATRQWEGLRAELARRAGLDDVEPADGLPDMPFAANAGLVHDGTFIPARFRFPQRQPEVPPFTSWFRDRGYRVVPLPSSGTFEGEGDALFQPGAPLVWGGYGVRTS